jgi:hypothetical protein
MMPSVVAGGEDLGHSELLERLGVVGWNCASDGNEHVVDVLLMHQFDDARHERHVRASEERSALAWWTPSDGLTVIVNQTRRCREYAAARGPGRTPKP